MCSLASALFSFAICLSCIITTNALLPSKHSTTFSASSDDQPPAYTENWFNCTYDHFSWYSKPSTFLLRYLIMG